MKRLAIIGAGTAGLAAAWALRDRPITIDVFEKSRGFSGRAATRGKYGVRYDHGANYFRTKDDRVAHLVHEALPTDELVDIEEAVWTFDGDGAVTQDDITADHPKWTYTSGINLLGKLMARQSTATVHTETRIERLASGATGWVPQDTEGEKLEAFDAVLLTPPAPQSADILRASAVEEDLKTRLVEGLQAAVYAAQFTIILAYERKVQRPDDVYGLVNADGEHDVGWIGFEDRKPGHVPDGQVVVVVQMGSGWSADRLDYTPDDLVPDAKEKASAVLDTSLRYPSWFDSQRWRYAAPTAGADTDALAAGADAGLFFAGDDVAGEGRVEQAIRSGLDAADRIWTTLQ